MPQYVSASVGLARALARRGATSISPSDKVKAAQSGVPLIKDIPAGELAQMLTAKQRADLGVALGGKANRPAQSSHAKSPATKPKTEAEARTEVRTTIAASQGLPPPPAAQARAATGSAPKPQPVDAQAVWERAIAANNPGHSRIQAARTATMPAKRSALSATSTGAQAVWERAIRANNPTASLPFQ